MRSILAIACVLHSGSAEAQPAYVLSSLHSPTENRVDNGYQQTMVIESDTREGGWRTFHYMTLIGWEQEPVRSNGSNSWVLQYHGVPPVVRGGDHFRIELRWRRVHTGMYQGKPYQHEAFLGFAGFADCGPSSPLLKDGRINMPAGSDELAGYVDYSCGDVVRGVNNLGVVSVNARPAGGFSVVYIYHKQDNAPAAAPPPIPGSAAGPRDPEPAGGLERGFDRYGGDYKDFDLSKNDPAECRAICASEPLCRAFTMAPAGMWHDRPHCWLKSTVPPTSPNSGRVSGVIARDRADGLERGFDRYGGDYRDFDLSRNDPAECRAACASESKCRSFAMAPAGMWSDRAHCWLKSSVPEATAAPNRISGVIAR